MGFISYSTEVLCVSSCFLTHEKRLTLSVVDQGGCLVFGSTNLADTKGTPVTLVNFTVDKTVDGDEIMAKVRD